MRNPPIRIQTDSEDNVLRVSIVDEWYDVLESIYQAFKKGSSLIAIKHSELSDFLEELTAEFGMFGLTVTISILYILKKAAERGIEIAGLAYAHNISEFKHTASPSSMTTE